MYTNPWGDTTHTDCRKTCKGTPSIRSSGRWPAQSLLLGPPSTPALPTTLLHKLIPAPCPTSHCINPSALQWALGPQRALCCPPLPQGDHSPVLGLATSQNWRVLWGRPPCQSTGSSTYARHSTCAHRIPGAERKHPALLTAIKRASKSQEPNIIAVP